MAHPAAYQSDRPLPAAVGRDPAEAEEQEAEGHGQLRARVGQPRRHEGELEGEGAEQRRQDLAVAVPSGEQLQFSDDRDVDSHFLIREGE